MTFDFAYKFVSSLIIIILATQFSCASPKIATIQVEAWLGQIEYKDKRLRKEIFEFVDWVAARKQLSPPSETDKLIIWKGFLQDYEIVFPLILEQYIQFYTPGEFSNLTTYFGGDFAPENYYKLLHANEKTSLLISRWLDTNISHVTSDLIVFYPNIDANIAWNTSFWVQKYKGEFGRFDVFKHGNQKPFSMEVDAALSLSDHLGKMFAGSLGEDIVDNLKKLNKERFSGIEYANMEARIAKKLRENLGVSNEPMISILKIYSKIFDRREIDNYLKYISLKERKNFLQIHLFEQDIFIAITYIMPKLPNFRLKLKERLKKSGGS